MKKRLTAIMMALIMAFAAAGTTATVQAATTPFMTVVWDGPVKEKVGNYYIWVKAIEDDYGQLDYELRCSKKASAKGTLLNTITGEDVITSIISNGQTIYYGVRCEDNRMMIYKTSVTGKNNKIFRTVKNVKTSCGPITVFNNRLYYDRDATDFNGQATWNIYSVNLNNKNCRLEKSGFKGQSGYGRYMTCDNESKYVKTQLYNAKTRKSTALIKSQCSRVYDGNIYYGSWDSMMAYVKKTNLAGKNLETLGKMGNEDSEHQVYYLGKKMAYFKSYSFGYITKLTYATKKLVPVKEVENTAGQEDESAVGGPIEPNPIEPNDDGEYKYIMTVDPIPDVLWQGKFVYPKVNVRVNGKILKKSQYTAHYVNNGGVGYGWVDIDIIPEEIEGIKYEDDISEIFNKTTERVEFKILHPRYKNTEGPIREISKVKNYYYTGKPIIPEYKVWGANVYLNKGVLLKEGIDYTAKITNNVKPGRAEIAVTGITYSNTHYRTFKILKAPIKRATITGITDRCYSGKAQVQNKMSLTYNGKKLKKGTDYTVKYKNNVKCGKASVIITGKGTYFTGNVTKTFNIVKSKPGKVILSNVKCEGHNAVKVTWKKSTNTKKYQVWRSTAKNGKYKLIKTTTAKTFTDKKLTSGKKYFYKVRAVNGTLKGKFSTIKNVKVYNHSYTSSVIKPTCSTQGYTMYTCGCGSEYKDNFIPAAEHDLTAVYRQKTEQEVVFGIEDEKVLEGYRCAYEYCDYVGSHVHICTEIVTEPATGEVYLMCTTEGCSYALAVEK